MEAELAEYRAWLVKRGRGSSAPRYVQMAERFLEDPDAYIDSISDTGYSPNYRRFLAACAKSWAKFEGDQELSQQLSDIRLPAPVPKDHREPFPFKTWQKIRRAIRKASYLKPAPRAVCSIIAVRGIRCGDILRVTRREFDQALKTGRLSFEGKGGRRQDYNARPMMTYLEELEPLWWRPEAERIRHLVCKSGNAKTASNVIVNAFTRVAEELGMDPSEVYAHRFRHTYATHYLQAMQGDPEGVFKLKDQMGWARLETASNYLRRSRREELDDIESAMLGLDGD